MTLAAFHLHPDGFAERERPLLAAGEFSAVTFRFESGVAALRLGNAQGEIVALPYQGQQLWSARFLGRDLAMRSMFDQPRATREYLETYGALLLHCGVTAMGVPAEGDSHPLHGELPNAPYRDVRLELGEDDAGAWLALTGSYQHTVAFAANYLAEPRLTLRAGSSVVEVSLTVTNLKRTPMELMYLAHANFRPVDGGRLVYSATVDPSHVRVRRSVPSHISPPEGYAEFLETLALAPERHHLMSKEQAFDPEVVFFIDYLADEDGWAHTLQRHPDGSADYLRHRPDELPIGVRWISRTPDQDALGLVLPATAEPEGHRAEKAKGNVLELAGGTVWRCRYALGALAQRQADEVEAHVEAITGR